MGNFNAMAKRPKRQQRYSFAYPIHKNVIFISRRQSMIYLKLSGREFMKNEAGISKYTK